MAVHLRKVAVRAWLIGLGTLASLLIVLVVALAWLVGTEAGRLTLIDTAETWLPRLTGQTLVVEGARLPGLGQWRLERLEWRAGPDGPRLTAGDLEIDWRPRYLWQRRIWIDRLDAADLTVELPRPGEAPASEPGEPPALPDLTALWPRLPALRLDRLAIDRLTLAGAERPPLVTAVAGDGEINWGSWPARLALTMHQGDNRLTLDVSVDAVEALSVTGELTGPADGAWADWLNWPLAEDLDGRWDLMLRQSNGQILADIETLALPWQGHRLAASGGLRYHPATGRLFFAAFELAADERSARLHGYLEADDASLTVTAEALPLSLAGDWLPLADLDGRVSMDGELTGGWRQPRFAGDLELDGQWRGDPLVLSGRTSASTDALVIDQLDARWGPARLAADGRVDWTADNLDLNLDWHGLGEDRWRPWVPAWPDDLNIATTSGEGRLSGPLSAPTLDARVNAEGRYRDQPLTLSTDLALTWPRLTLTDLSLGSELGGVEGDLELGLDDLAFSARTRLSDLRSAWLDVFGVSLPVDQDWGLSGQLDWSGRLTEPRASGELTLAGRWQAQPLDARLAVRSLTLAGLSLGDSRLTLGEAGAELSGDIDWAAARLDLDTRLTALTLDDLRPWLPPLPAELDDLAGSLGGSLSVRGPWSEPAVSADLGFAGEWRDTPLNLDVTLQASDRELWRVQQADLAWGEGLRANYQGELRPFEPGLDGRFELTRLETDALARLPIDLPAELAELNGRASAAGRISGALTEPLLSELSVDFSGDYRDTPLDLAATASHLDRERLAVDALTLSSGTAGLELAGEIAWRPLTLDVNAELSRLDWARVRPWLPASAAEAVTSLSGTASGRLQARGRWPALSLDGELSAEGQYRDQPFAFDWRGTGEWAGRLDHDLTLDWGQARLTGQVVSEGERLDGQASLAAMTLAQLRALGAPIGEGIEGRVDADLEVAGALTDPDVTLNLDARGQWPAGSAGLAETADWRLAVHAAGNRDAWRLEDAEADLGPAGQLSLSGAGDLDSLELNGRLSIEETRYWLDDRPEWAGSLDGRFALAGTPAAPGVELDLDWRSSRWPLTLGVDLTTEAGEHRLDAVLAEAGTERLALEAVTAQTSLADWGASPVDRPFAAEVTFKTDSTVIEPLLQGRPDQDFRGQVDGRLSIDGTLARPQWAGRMELTDGRYENATYGTVLSDLRASLSADNRRLVLDLTAGDDSGGRVRLDGSVVWPEDRPQWWMPELDLTLATRTARLLRRADMDASVDGDLTVTGPWRDLVVAGELEVAPLTLQLDSLLQSGAPTLNVVRASDQSEADEAEAADRASPYAPQGRWQVRLRANRRAQLYGQGLEAELSGELDLTDELGSPAVGGRFQVVRGTYTAFGKIFQIESGSIQVQGSQILLDIRASYTDAELDVELQVSGDQDRLNLTLTSNPPLANDELLARLLFGRSLSEMSAFQAFQLASALNSLRDPGSGLDLFGTTRDLLGLDALTLDSGTNEAGDTGVNVQAGKYLSDRLYLEVESGVRTEQSFAGSLQFEVTPQVSLELYTNGQFGSGGLELNWSNDY